MTEFWGYSKAELEELLSKRAPIRPMAPKPRAPRDGDGDGFYSVRPGAPDRTPVPPKMRGNAGSNLEEMPRDGQGIVHGQPKPSWDSPGGNRRVPDGSRTPRPRPNRPNAPEEGDAEAPKPRAPQSRRDARIGAIFDAMGMPAEPVRDERRSSRRRPPRRDRGDRRVPYDLQQDWIDNSVVRPGSGRKPRSPEDWRRPIRGDDEESRPERDDREPRRPRDDRQPRRPRDDQKPSPEREEEDSPTTGSPSTPNPFGSNPNSITGDDAKKLSDEELERIIDEAGPPDPWNTAQGVDAIRKQNARIARSELQSRRTYSDQKQHRAPAYSGEEQKRVILSDLVLKALNDRYDPDARDGDSDGRVQEGSAFERPATARNPKGRGGRIRRAASRALDRLKPSRRRRRLRDGLGDIGDRGDMSAQERAQSLGKRPLNLPDEGRRGAASPMPSDDETPESSSNETPEEMMARLEAEFQKMREEDLFDWLGQDDDEVDETSEDLLASLENMFDSMVPFEWEADLPKDGFTPENLSDLDDRIMARDLVRRLMITDEELREMMNGSRSELVESIFSLKSLLAAFRARLDDPDSYSMENLNIESADEWFPDVYRTVDFTLAERISSIIKNLEDRLGELRADAGEDSGEDSGDMDKPDPESVALWDVLERVIDRQREKEERDQRLWRAILAGSDSLKKPAEINKLEVIPEPDSPWSEETVQWIEEYLDRFGAENPEADWSNGLMRTNDIEEDSWMYDDMDDPATEERTDDFTVRTSPPKPIPTDPPDGIPQELWDAYLDYNVLSDEPFDEGPPPLWERQLSFVGWLAEQESDAGRELLQIDEINYLHNMEYNGSEYDGFEIVPLDEIKPVERLDVLAAQLERLFYQNPKKWEGVFPMLVASRYLAYRNYLKRYSVRYRDPERLGERIPGGLKPLTLEEFANRLLELESPD